MNHKRKRPKNRRAGCLMCKPHKASGAKQAEKPQYVPRNLELKAALAELTRLTEELGGYEAERTQ
jgi:hypothetical protein